MKSALIVAMSLIMVFAVTVTDTLAQQARGGKGHPQRGADGDNNAAAIQQNRLAAAGQQGQERMMRKGMQQNGAANVPQLAQLMVANFDQNGDGALNQGELEGALFALMQQMQAGQQMAGGQALAAAGGQGNCQGGAAAMNQVRTQTRNGQFAAGQGGAQRFTSGGGGNGKGGGGGGGKRGGR